MAIHRWHFALGKDAYCEIVGGRSHCGSDGGCEYHRKGVY